jgi:hypothetical protein
MEAGTRVHWDVGTWWQTTWDGQGEPSAESSRRSQRCNLGLMRVPTIVGTKCRVAGIDSRWIAMRRWRMSDNSLEMVARGPLQNSCWSAKWEVGGGRLVGADGRWDAMSGSRWRRLLGCDLESTRGGVGRSLGAGSRRKTIWYVSVIEVGMQAGMIARARRRMDEGTSGFVSRPLCGGSRWDLTGHAWVIVACMQHWDAGGHRR